MNPKESREDWTTKPPTESRGPADPPFELLRDCIGRVVSGVLDSMRVRVEVEDAVVRATVIVPVGGREMAVTVAASHASMDASRAFGLLRLTFTDLRRPVLLRRSARSGALEQAADRIRELKRTKGGDDDALSYEDVLEQAARAVEAINP